MAKCGAENKKTSFLYRIIRRIVFKIYPKYEIMGEANLPDEPCVIVGNHSQLHGPLVAELCFIGKRYIWCAGQMMKLKEVPSYTYKDFWSFKPKYSRWMYKIISFIIAPLAVLIFNNAHTIPVYHDSRLLSTFKTTVNKLSDGANIIIYPEHNVKHNHIVYDFQDKFVDIARFYYKRTGKEISFVPFYIAPKLKKVCLGKPIKFDSTAPIDEERKRICRYLMDKITDTACSLPNHTVIPYRNIPKKDYPLNTGENQAFKNGKKT